MNATKCLKCGAEYDSDVRTEKLRHEYAFCLTSPRRRRDKYSVQKRKDVLGVAGRPVVERVYNSQKRNRRP